MRMLWKLIKDGWHVVTEVHTVYWILVDILGITVPSTGVVVLVGWLGEHSPTMLVLVLLVAIVAFAVLLLTFLGYRTDQKVALSSKQVGLSGPDITVDVDKEAQRIGDYQQVCAITITNVEAKELDRCLVEITKFSRVRPKGMPMPLTLRTEEQVRGGGAGRFTLSKGQRKAIPILFVRTQRANEWFFFDENKKQYFIPAHPTELRLRIYGGDEPLAVVLFIDVDAGWNALAKLTMTSKPQTSTMRRIKKYLLERLRPNYTVT
jgi:hypothetical protein